VPWFTSLSAFASTKHTDATCRISSLSTPLRGVGILKAARDKLTDQNKKLKHFEIEVTEYIMGDRSRATFEVSLDNEVLAIRNRLFHATLTRQKTFQSVKHWDGRRHNFVYKPA
jgi:hypothetical protein